jgi:sugar phosphate isomerase/epimerase
MKNPIKMIPVALQLWSLRDDCARDFAGTVSAVSKMGYTGVELAGYGNLDAKSAKAAIEAAHLKVAGMHHPIQAFNDDVQKIVGDALLLGSPNVTCAWWPDTHFVSDTACQEIGRRLNEIGSMMRAYGLRFSYHNHGGEMRRLNGRTALEWMLGASEPRNVEAEVDVYWANFGGVPPGDLLRRLGSRCTLVHLKDSKEIGRGPVDFREVFAAVDSVGAAEWLIVEIDEYSRPPLESVQECIEKLREWGRA